MSAAIPDVRKISILRRAELARRAVERMAPRRPPAIALVSLRIIEQSIEDLALPTAEGVDARAYFSGDAFSADAKLAGLNAQRVLGLLRTAALIEAGEARAA